MTVKISCYFSEQLQSVDNVPTAGTVLVTLITHNTSAQIRGRL